MTIDCLVESSNRRAPSTCTARSRSELTSRWSPRLWSAYEPVVRIRRSERQPYINATYCIGLLTKPIAREHRMNQWLALSLDYILRSLVPRRDLLRVGIPRIRVEEADKRCF